MKESVIKVNIAAWPTRKSATVNKASSLNADPCVPAATLHGFVGFVRLPESPSIRCGLTGKFTGLEAGPLALSIACIPIRIFVVQKYLFSGIFLHGVTLAHSC
jgi:hypothetical protein